MAERARTILMTFNGGERTPLLDGRTDQDAYFTGCRVAQNFVPTVQGPIRRRGGTRFVGTTKGNGVAWLVDFVFSADQAYILEFGDGYIRFFVSRGQLLDGSGDPYEISTPYAIDDLTTSEGTFALRMVQSLDVMWVTHVSGLYPPYKLSRLGATNWTFTEVEFTDGPWRDVNTVKTNTMVASGTTGSVTVTANFSAFQAGHVGSLLILNSLNVGNIVPYQTYKTVSAGTQWRNAGNVYEAVTSLSSVDSSTVRYIPTHTEGQAYDGAVLWEYKHSGYGWGRITAVASDGLSCTLTVLSDSLPNEVVSTQTHRWAFSEFSSVYGWPHGVAFFRERLTFFRDKQVFHSATGDYSSFNPKDAGDVTSETAMSIELAADKLDSIRWVMQARDLLVGSARSELTLGEQTTTAVYSATNVLAAPWTEYGSRSLPALRVGDSTLFVERSGHRVRDMRPAESRDGYAAEDMTVLAEHLFDGSEADGDDLQEPRTVLDWAYQQQRDGTVWCVMSDGRLAALTLNRERGVVAWTPHVLGGSAAVKAVRSIPAPDGKSDDVWFIVERTVDGAVQRSVEYMTDFRLVKSGLAEAVHVDCSVTYRGAETSTITGLDHLEGATVSVMVDGLAHVDQVVSGGQITLSRPGSLVHVGYPFSSRFQSMRLDVGSGAGTSQTVVKGISDVWLRLQSTVGGKIGSSFDSMDVIPTMDASSPVGTAPSLFNGDLRAQFPGGLDTDGYVCYEQSDPYPATLVALVVRSTLYG